MTGRLKWDFKHPEMTLDHLGFIPEFINTDDPRGAAKQIDEAYISGWSPFPGFEMKANGDLLYPGDPPTRLLAEAKLREETIRFYDHAWLAIVQPDGTFEVARLD